ncbi:MAG: class I SAM-dependent methyltransferase [Desulfomonile sp.]|nr:class I SAM-dependent methyltransferase [Desulfomonile sp.]
MEQHVCPWWIGYLLANPIRKLFQNPMKILSPYVKTGMTVLEVGSGMGFFTIPLARLVGPEGRVIAVDIQERMLRGVRTRARRAGLEDRVHTVLCEPDKLEAPFPADFSLVFATAHEAPHVGVFFQQIRSALKPAATLLLVEPKYHVSESDFAAIVTDAEWAGFAALSRPMIRGSRSALLAVNVKGQRDSI